MTSPVEPAAKAMACTAGNRGDSAEPWTSDSRDGSSSSRPHRAQDRQSCCSCTDELTRLESRLAAMESRLSDFEAVLLRSVSGGDTTSYWPGSSDAAAPPVQTKAQFTNDDNFSTTNRNASYRISTDDTACQSGLSTSSQRETPLNLVFTEIDEEEDDEDSQEQAVNTERGENQGLCGMSYVTGSSSTTWTDLGGVSKAAEELKVAEKIQQVDAEPAMAGSSDESFELVRYSTQESILPQQQFHLTSSLSGASGSECHAVLPWRPPPPPTLSMTYSGAALGRLQFAPRRHTANEQLSLTTSPLAGHFALPLEKLGCSVDEGTDNSNVVLTAEATSVIEPSVQRAHAGVNSASVVVAETGCFWRHGFQQQQPQRATVAVAARRFSEGDIGGVAAMADPPSFAPPPARVRQPIVQPEAIDDGYRVDDDDAATDSSAVSSTFGTEGVAAAAAAAAEVGVDAAGRRATRQLRQRQVVGRGSGSAATESSVARGGAISNCRLCRDLGPYVRARVSDLERRGGGQLRCRGSEDVCIQKSGMSKLNTVLIAGLVVKATSLFPGGEGDQARYVRLTLRRLGFECAVVIGRHFTGCICGLDSSRLLLDIGDHSCLIFSFFRLNADLSQLNNV